MTQLYRECRVNGLRIIVATPDGQGPPKAAFCGAHADARTTVNRRLPHYRMVGSVFLPTLWSDCLDMFNGGHRGKSATES